MEYFVPLPSDVHFGDHGGGNNDDEGHNRGGDDDHGDGCNSGLGGGNDSHGDND